MRKKRKSTKTTLQKKAEFLKEGSVLSANYTHSRKTREIIEYFREGLTDKEIFVKILQNNPQLKESSATVYLASARASFKQEYDLDRRFNIIQHVRRYDRDILTLSKYTPKTSSYSKFQFEKTQAYLDMVSLLQKKERVLGFHRKSNKIKINNNININLRTKKTFDLSSLTWEEKVELYEYIGKSKINENEKLVLTPNQNKLDREKSEDKEIIEDAVVVSDELNINSIKEKDDASIDTSFGMNDDTINVDEDKNVVDATNKVGVKKTQSIEDIKSILLNKITKK